MKAQAGRTVLSVLAFVAVAATVMSLGTSDRAVSGGIGCPLNCSGNGVCLNGSFCDCDPCFTGTACQAECSGNGICLNATSCLCGPCFSGPLCGIECSNNGFCGNGSCICDPGFGGALCQTPASTSSTTTSSSTVSTTSSTSTTTSTTLPAVSFIGVVPKKLVVVDKLGTAAAKAKTVFVSKDTAAGITKGPGEDENLISVDFTVRYDDGAAAGSFALPAGATDGTSGWVSNKSTVAKYVNKAAPGGPTEAKVGVIKPAKLLKLVGKGLGDVPFDIYGAGAPAGSVYTAYCVENDGVENCHCSELTGCIYKLIASDLGAKLVCKQGVADPTCEALSPATAECPTNGDPPAFCSNQPGYCGASGPCASCLGANLNASLACDFARCSLNCSSSGANANCGTWIISAGCENECCL